MTAFEINAVWAAASWTSASRATAITNGVTSSKLPLSFIANESLNAASFRLHEICFSKATKPGTITKPFHDANLVPKRGPLLAQVLLDILKEERKGDLSDFETDRQLFAEDLEGAMQKGSKEFVKSLS